MAIEIIRRHQFPESQFYGLSLIALPTGMPTKQALAGVEVIRYPGATIKMMSKLPYGDLGVHVGADKHANRGEGAGHGSRARERDGQIERQ